LKCDEIEELLVECLLLRALSAGQAVVAVLDADPSYDPMAVCFALVTVAADLRSSADQMYDDLATQCFETAALLSCEAYALGCYGAPSQTRQALLSSWGEQDAVFHRHGFEHIDHLTREPVTV
jgi:hypothetical protein